MTGSILIVGGGVSGLFAAHKAKSLHPNAHVIVVEQAPEVGGLLRSFDYGENGIFDHGVHTFYETGVPEIDDYFLSLLPEQDWKFMTDYSRDLGGSWHEDRLQYNSPYVDLAALPEPRKQAMIASFFTALDTVPTDPGDMDAMSYATARYGAEIAEQIVRPAVEARQHMPADQAHWMALNIQGLSRVNLLPRAAIEVLSQSPDFAARLGFPDQTSYPEKYLSGKRAYYPAKFGLGRFIDALRAQIEAEGIEIVTSAGLSNLELADGKIARATVTQGDATRVLDIAHLYWSVSLHGLAGLLGLDTKKHPFDPPNQTVICNLLTEDKPNCGGTYYSFYHGHPRIHRVSHGYNYSDDALVNGLYPTCVELVYPRGSATDTVNQDVEGWLRAAGVFQPGNTVKFAKTEVLRGGYPMLSQKNVASMIRMRDEVIGKQIANLTSIGILSQNNLFFQFDLIRHINDVVQ